MYSNSTPSLSNSTTSSDSDGGGFYGKKSTTKNKTSKKKRTNKRIPNGEDKHQTTIDEPEFYPLPRSMKNENNSQQNRKFQTAYLVPSPLDYDLSIKWSKPRAPSTIMVGSNVRRDGAMWSSNHHPDPEIRPILSQQDVYVSPGPKYGLPTLCGKSSHDPRSSHKKNPSYPMADRHRELSDNSTPGPHYLVENVYRTGKDNGRHFSLSSRRHDLTSY